MQSLHWIVVLVSTLLPWCYRCQIIASLSWSVWEQKATRELYLILSRKINHKEVADIFWKNLPVTGFQMSSGTDAVTVNCKLQLKISLNKKWGGDCYNRGSSQNRDFDQHFKHLLLGFATSDWCILLFHNCPIQRCTLDKGSSVKYFISSWFYLEFYSCCFA